MLNIKNQYSFYYPDWHISDSIPESMQLYYQITRVLRLKVKDYILLSNGNGKKAVCQLYSISKNYITFKILEELQQSEAKNKTHLVVGAVKKDTLKIVLRQGVELGVESFHIVESEYSKISLLSLTKKKEYLYTIIKEAFEQSMRFFLPSIIFYYQWQNFFEAVLSDSNVLIAHKQEDYSSHMISSCNIDKEHVYLCVGPEGGFSLKELNYFNTHQVRYVSLGKNILKVDTACLVGVSQILYSL